MSRSPDWRCEVLDLIYAVARRRVTVALILVAALLIGYTLATTAERYYRASTTIVLLPREKPILDLSVQSASVETTDDAAKRSPAATLTLPPNPDLYTTLIRSAEVTERVAVLLESDSALDGRAVPKPAEIRAGMSVDSTEEGVIRIAILHADPIVAAAAVNALVHECQHASKAIERQLILQQAGFLGKAIEQADMRLSETRERLAAFSTRYGVADPTVAAARSAKLIQTLDDTEARLDREMERLLVHRTRQDPAVSALAGEIAQVRSRRERMQSAYCGELSEMEFAEVEARWSAIAQDVTLRQDLLMSMRARHDLFSIRANQPAGNIAVIRPATPPKDPAGPSRRKALVLAALIGGLLACAVCVLMDQLERIRNDEHAADRLVSIRDCFRVIRPNPAKEVTA